MESSKPKAVSSGVQDERFFVKTGSNHRSFRLFYSTTLDVKMRCDMEFDNFPFDEHHCDVVLSSLRNPNDVKWEITKSNWNQENLKHPEFDCTIESQTEGVHTSVGITSI